MPSPKTNTTLRLGVSRHLQDFNGYCGPACAMMVIDFTGSAKSPPVFAQNELFREVRDYARNMQDRRPMKSPAESLLALVNDHSAAEFEWAKVYDPDPIPVAKQVIHAISEQSQPCLLLVSKGMHWVVAFGVQRKDDGSPAGLLMRDPAWAGMPKFYGLTRFPEKPTIEHTPTEVCQCLQASPDNPPGTVHERYYCLGELISTRGLQGSKDWEGDGAIALIPEGTSKAAAAPALAVAAPATPIPNAKEKAGQAVLDHMREHGLHGRPDSPPEWNAALDNAQAGDPILVKDPDDPRDDFFLVPLIPQDPNAKHGVWAMLDTQTLELREASLLENWKALAFPDTDSGDAELASQQEHTLPDGTTARFKPEDFTPNKNNLVWKASAASILPYWPLKELTAPHPITGEPVPIYITQDGKVYSQLLPDERNSNTNTPQTPNPQQLEASPKPNKNSAGKAGTIAVALGATTAILMASTAYFAHKSKGGEADFRNTISDQNSIIEKQKTQIKQLTDNIDDSPQTSSSMEKTIAGLNSKISKLNEEHNKEKRKLADRLRSLGNSNRDLKNQVEQGKTQVQDLNNKQQELLSTIARWQKTYNILKAQHTDAQKAHRLDKQRINDLTGQLLKKTTEANHLEKQITALETRRRQDLARIKSLDQQIAKLQAALLKLQKRKP